MLDRWRHPNFLLLRSWNWRTFGFGIIQQISPQLVSFTTNWIKFEELMYLIFLFNFILATETLCSSAVSTPSPPSSRLRLSSQFLDIWHIKRELPLIPWLRVALDWHSWFTQKLSFRYVICNIFSKYSFEHEHLMDTYFFTYSWAHHPSGLFCSSPCCWSSALTLNSVVSNPSSLESLITGPNISDQGDSTSLWSWLSSCASSDCPWSLKAEFTSSNLWISTLLLECLCYGNF